MVAEANKEEAERCAEIGRRHLRSGDKEKAIKFLTKALKLDPTSSLIKELLNRAGEKSRNNTKKSDSSTSNGAPSGYAHYDHYEEPGLRSRRARQQNKFKASASQPSFSRADADEEEEEAEEDATPSSRGRSRSAGRRERSSARQNSQPNLGVDYTQEELNAVNRIRHSRDYYEILGVEKSATEIELKKNYRKLALQFHPDKCRAPGATEAFKAIGNAYAVLSDTDKRQRYDMYGSDGPVTQNHRRSSGFYEYDYSRGFEADFTPEEIFNMFFGGGPPMGHVRRRQRGGNAYYYQFNSDDQHTSQQGGGLHVALQLLPILILLMLSVASQLFIGDPAYNLQRNSKYNQERRTSDLGVTYYVKADFMQHYRNTIGRIEQQVEDEFINNLRLGCYRERSQKENMMWRARTFGDGDLWQKAQHMATPNCDRLQQIYH